jgi:hypothetical protein
VKGSSLLSLWWLRRKKNLPLGFSFFHCLMHWRIERDIVHLFTFVFIVVSQSVIFSLSPWLEATLFFFLHTIERATSTKRWNVAEKERKKMSARWINAIICTRIQKGERHIDDETSNRVQFLFLIYNLINEHSFSASIKLINYCTLANSHGWMMSYWTCWIGMCFKQCHMEIYRYHSLSANVRSQFVK